jgi:hypothetical protein
MNAEDLDFKPFFKYCIEQGYRITSKIINDDRCLLKAEYNISNNIENVVNIICELPFEIKEAQNDDGEKGYEASFKVTMTNISMNEKEFEDLQNTFTLSTSIQLTKPLVM